MNVNCILFSLISFVSLAPSPLNHIIITILNMETLVHNFATSDALADYLMETCSGDGLEFWIDVEFFKRINDPAEAKDTAKRIYNTYIMPTATKEILLNPLLKHQLVRKMSSLREEDIKEDMFNEAQDAVGEVLAARCQATDKLISKPKEKSRFTLIRQNTFPRQLSSKLKKYNKTITKEKSLINFDAYLK